MVVWDATELSFDCQTTVFRMSGTPRVSNLLPFIPKVTPTDLSFGPQLLCQSEQGRFTLTPPAAAPVIGAGENKTPDSRANALPQRCCGSPRACHLPMLKEKLRWTCTNFGG